MRYLTKRQVIRLNKATIEAHGGNFMSPYNFLHEENLDYLVEAVQTTIFGQPLYPTVIDKERFTATVSSATIFLRTAINALV